MAPPSSRANAEFVAARFLQKPGSKYEKALKTFEAYAQVEENPEAEGAGRQLIAAGPKPRTFVFVNNRLEGNTISTVAMVGE